MVTNDDRVKIEKYLANQDNIDVAYLFGSQTTTKANVLSDIDIALLFNGSMIASKRFNQKLKIMGELGTLLKTNDIDIVDLNSADTVLKFSAIENRDLLLVKDNSVRSVFEADTMTKYQDYKYYLTMNTSNSLASISRMEV